jgi:hypothetical protein
MNMTETTHEGNDTPEASDEGIERTDADTPQAAPGAAVEDQGVGQNPADATDPDENDDPKSGGTPVHPAPTEDSPRS